MIWRVIRREVGGAWRSLRYDVTGRRSPDNAPTEDLRLPRHALGAGPLGGESSGAVPPRSGRPRSGRARLGGARPGGARPGGHAADKPGPRVVTAGLVGLLAVVGAIGTYYAVIGGLGVLLEDADTARPLPSSPAVTRPIVTYGPVASEPAGPPGVTPGSAVTHRPPAVRAVAPVQPPPPTPTPVPSCQCTATAEPSTPAPSASESTPTPPEPSPSPADPSATPAL